MFLGFKKIFIFQLLKEYILLHEVFGFIILKLVEKFIKIKFSVHLNDSLTLGVKKKVKYNIVRTPGIPTYF